MKLIIQKNAKKFGIFAVMLILLGAVVYGGDILAIILPNIEDLQIVSYKVEQEEYVYTGEENQPVVTEINFKDKKENDVTRTQEEITVVTYHDNVDFGNGDIEIKVKGYLGTVVLEDAFLIKPAGVENMSAAQVSDTAIDLNWTEVAGAEGYHIFRKEKAETEDTLLAEISDGQTLSYQDTDVTYNKVYEYKVCAFGTIKEEGKAETAEADAENSTETENVTELEPEILFGEVSNVVKIYTPLATPVLSNVEGVNFDSIKVEWEAVEGAIGYQVLRSESANGEFAMISEIKDADTLSYTDTTCECGKEYFYNVKACQQLETETVYGQASNTKSAKTSPNKVNITGKTTNTNTKVSLSWKKSEGAGGYEIYKKEGSSDYKLVKKIEKADTLNWEESGLTKDKEYTYRIRPYCTVGETTVTGAYSNTYKKEAYVEPVVSNPSTGSSNSGSSNNSSSGNNSGSSSSTSGSASGSLSGVTKYVGVPYVYGGNTPSGWDCSGFTKWVMKNYYGITISRTAASQATGGKAVSKSNRSAWQAGDLIFFSNGSRISHVGLYLGNGKMMHALNEKYDTVIQSVDYYESWDPGNYLACVRRYH